MDQFAAIAIAIGNRDAEIDDGDRPGPSPEDAVMGVAIHFSQDPLARELMIEVIGFKNSPDFIAIATGGKEIEADPVERRERLGVFAGIGDEFEN